MDRMATSSWPCFTEEEVTAVGEVLRSNKVNYWTGEQCRKFEAEFAAWGDSRYAIAVANGTVALDLALIALNLGSGDEVIVTSRTFIASVSCIVNAGAKPVFCDIDADSQNITASEIEKLITDSTRAIVCVHLAGWPCDMDSILKLADQHNLYVIEDCAQAHGARYKGKSVGSFGHIGAWSFCQDKIMTTGGEGGMITTDNHDYWSKMWSFKDHGKSWEKVNQKSSGTQFKWLHESFGTNWRMTEMQAAIGRIQLKRMPDWHKERTANAMRILRQFAKFDDVFRAPLPPQYIEHAWYKCYVFVRPENLKNGWTRDRIIEEFIACGVTCSQGSCSEVYLEKAFEDPDFRPSTRLPVARALGETSVMFLVHPGLLETELTAACHAIEAVYNKITSH